MRQTIESRTLKKNTRLAKDGAHAALFTAVTAFGAYEIGAEKSNGLGVVLAEITAVASVIYVLSLLNHLRKRK